MVLLMVNLSKTTEQLVEKLFSPEERDDVHQLLIQQCGNNLPFLGNADEYKLERFRFAALKLSQGDLEALSRAVQLAQRDWRDLLMAADFGNDLQAHEKWAQSILNGD